VAGSSSRKTVLIVDDDDDLRRMFRTALMIEGFTVEEASDGAAALYRIHHEPPDLIILDLSLPTVSGVIVHQELAAHAHTRQIPVVVVTGSSMSLDHLEVPCVLRKPVSPDKLVTTVRECLRQQSGTLL
jgi:DNA-binding response OmpR family regulator